ncbi:MAG: hypothetical protein AAGD96_18670 [Chloroflexota bacterium]
MKKFRVIVIACLCLFILAACNSAEPVVEEPAEEAVSQTNAPEEVVVEEETDEEVAEEVSEEVLPAIEDFSQTGDIKVMGGKLLKSRGEDPFTAGGQGLSLSMNQVAESAQTDLANLIPTMDEMLAPSGPSNGMRVNRLGSGTQAGPAFTTELGERITISQGGFSLQPPISGFENFESSGEFTADAMDNYYSIYVSGRELEAGEDVDEFFDLAYDYVTNESNYPEFADSLRMEHPEGKDGFMLEGEASYRKQDIRSIFVVENNGDWIRVFISSGETEGWENGYGELTTAVRESVLGLNEAMPIEVKLDDPLTSQKGAFTVQPPVGYSNRINMSDGSIEMKDRSGPTITVTTEKLKSNMDADEHLDSVFENVFEANGFFNNPQRQPHPEGKTGFLMDEMMVISDDVSLRVWAVVTVQGDTDVSFMAMADPDAWENGFESVVEAVYESLDIKVEDVTAASGFTTITDNEDVISVSVPASWDDIDGRFYTTEDGDFDGYGLDIAPDLDNLYSGWSVPGITIYAIEDDGYSTSGYLDSYDLSEMCDYAGREKFSEYGLRGHFDLWNNCGRNNALYFDLAVVSADDAFISMQMTIVEEADLDTLGIIVESLAVDIP